MNGTGVLIGSHATHGHLVHPRILGAVHHPLANLHAVPLARNLGRFRVHYLLERIAGVRNAL